MTSEIFRMRLQELMRSAFNDPPIPINVMILELEVEKNKCLMHRLNLDARQEAQELAHKILPANGALKVN